MKLARIASIFAIAVVVLFVLAAVIGRGQQIQVVTSTMTFVDSDTACINWPSVSAPYALSQAPNPASSLDIFVNGLRWTPGEDFALNGAAVTLANGQAFAAGDVVACRYRVMKASGN